MTIFLNENQNLEFSFEKCQEVLQYDSSHFYREKIEKNISGIDAMDFLCIDTNRKCSFLIEVKDFSQLTVDKAKEHKNRQSAEDLAVEISRKTFDTIAGLCIASFSPQCRDEEKDFAQRFLKYPMHIVFHYELPQKWQQELKKSRMADIKARLKRKLQIIDSQIQIENLSSTRYWTVTRKNAS